MKDGRTGVQIHHRASLYLVAPGAKPVLAEYTHQVYHRLMIRVVLITERAQRDLQAVPRHVLLKLMGWTAMVEQHGLEEARRIPGYHDEPLLGRRKGQRSIRLSRSYRAIYIIRSRDEGSDAIEFVSVEEVNKHAY